MLKRVFPFLGWFEDYGLEALRIDLIAGLTVALVLIPQSMAYAQLAGLPAYYGLYASFLPPMVAALFGSSLQLATGPVAVVSLMTSASLEPLATAGSEGYILYAILLALMVGAFQFSLGVLKLGLVVNFLSHPVVNGFTNAAALIIASSQLSKLFGVYVDKGEHYYETILRVVQAALHYTHWPSFLMGASAFAIMYGLRWLSPKIPNVLLAVLVTTLLAWTTGFEHNMVVDIATIESQTTRKLIGKYNSTVHTLSKLAEEKAEVNADLERANRSHNIINVLETEHRASILVVNMERIKEQARHYRQKIRGLLLRAVTQPAGSLKFYPRDRLPAGVRSDNRTWRIKVGSNPLALSRILMIGGGAVVGAVPRGLPALRVPTINLTVMVRLFPFAVIISLLGFMEAISIAKAMAGKTGQRLDPNQELIGQGLANILGAFTRSYPTSGSFSRSAVNLQAGAVTGLSSVFTSLMVVVVLLFFTPLLYHLPQAVLAAVIMMAVIGLVNVSGFIQAWETQWYDGVIAIITFVCTLGFAPHLHLGIMVGVVLSLLVFLYKSMRPTVATLSRAADQSLRDCVALGLKQCKYMAMVRFDGPLFFANASYLEDQIMDLMLSKKELRHIIIVSNGINDIDASGEETLSLLVDRIRSAGIDVSLSGVNEAVMQVFKRTHFPEKIGEDHIYPTMEMAIAAIHEKAHREGQEEICPLLTCCRLS